FFSSVQQNNNTSICSFYVILFTFRQVFYTIPTGLSTVLALEQLPQQLLFLFAAKHAEFAVLNSRNAILC
ncbi:MAG: hypothetical protein AAF547_08905, partial [Actinomycetota bacterium]